MIPQIAANDIQNIQVVPFPSRTHQITERRIEGDIDGIQALRQAVMAILSTERYAYIIYEENHGSELEKYIGKDFAFIKAGIGLDITDALMQDDRIVDVIINSIIQSRLDAVLIDFTVVSTSGTFREAVTINV